LANQIQIKRTSVSGRAANTTTLTNPGELALNMSDGILYSTNGSVVFEIGANNTNAQVTGTLTVNAISANGGVGTDGQVLTSNGSVVYWASAGSGSVTSVATGNGLTGGPITTSGTVSILANTGIVANSTGAFVNSDYIATIAANSATYANSSVTNTFTVGTASYFVANGNLGIGNSAPVSELHVQGTVTATDFDSLSDIKLKENIQSLNNSIDIINQINPVSFNWKDTGEKSYGVIAQEIENILPDIVNSKGENKSVSYIQIIALLIDSIKELDKEIKILKLKNDKFEKQLNNLNI